MSMLTRWSPFRPATRFNPITDIDDMFRGLNLLPFMGNFATAMEMRIDVNEDDRNYRVKVDVPGVKKEDIEVSVDGNQVTVQAESKREESRSSGRDLYTERYAGKLFRAFTLPQDVDGNKCEASYENGVLSLTLPKKNNGQAKRLPIH